ncbi:MAG: hypothetical protein Q4D61_08050, partial [Cardiobacteriaceae bacterium]|nr:hypothetical protein [Cardiobacteriaceae bacterium]
RKRGKELIGEQRYISGYIYPSYPELRFFIIILRFLRVFYRNKRFMIVKSDYFLVFLLIYLMFIV